MTSNPRLPRRLGLGLCLLTALVVGGTACAQQVSIDPDTQEWIRDHGRIRDLALEQRYPDPATPHAVRLLLLEGEPDSTTAYYLRWFPLVYGDPSSSPFDLLNELDMLTDTMDVYGWVTPPAFADDLRAHLSTARSLLTGGDRPGAAASVAAFRAAVETAYRQPEPGEREATREAHRFLFWPAQDLLDRLGWHY